ncbi:MAG: VTT domain-containing protein [Pseudomonadota bacterium]|nr:VTT domain-containing protein [Pseudomonadota bacterium]
MSESFKVGSGFTERGAGPESVADRSSRRRGRYRLAAVLAVLILLVGVLAAVSSDGAFAALRDPDAFGALIARLGFWGPVAVIASMTLAIIFSPLPSAPIALASGAIYGHTLGTVYVLVGAEAGALAAFAIARVIGGGLIERWPAVGHLDRLRGSQGTLMAIVFVTRLMPFVSFDAVSYAAGLTPLSFWRFALATLAGILPASFLLAHFGAELASADAGRVGLALLVLGLGVLVPLFLRLIRQFRGR